MDATLKKMQEEYDVLTNLLSEATVNPESITQWLDCKYYMWDLFH